MRLISKLAACSAAWIFFLCVGEGRAAAGLQSLRGLVPETVAALPPEGRLPGTNRLDLAIGLPLRNGDKLAQLLADISDPKSPRYRQYLTAAQFAEQFGPAPADYAAVSNFAQAHGLKITGTHGNRLLLDVNGAVADIESAFHVELHTYRHPAEGRIFFAPDRDPTIDLTTPVLGVGGLNDYQKPHPCSQRLSSPQPNLTGSGPSGAYLGNDFRAAYAPGVTMTGAGQSVALVEFSSGFMQSDITAYEDLAGLPNVPLSAVLLDGYDGGPGVGNDEVSLDIEMAMAMAPGLAGVIVYEGTTTDDILNRIATDNSARQISASWNYPIDANTEQIFMEFAAQGQTFFNASGDRDAYTGAVTPPSDDPNITIVGGTTLTTAGPGGGWAAETVWNWGVEYGSIYNGLGSSGGVSTVYPIPSWQTNINMSANQGSTTMRNLPDVAMTADNVYVIYGGGQTGAYGGTSCATPLWAGFAALANQLAAASGRPALGFINPAIDSICSAGNYAPCFHDITTGNNTKATSTNEFFAAPGYDLCTGWGAPAGQNLINALAVPDSLEVLPDGGFTAIGGSGGPFTVTNEYFALNDTSTNSLSWSAVNTNVWLTVTPAAGTLAGAGSSANPSVSLSPAAYSLPIGTYSAQVGFSNAASGTVQTRQFILQIVPAAPPSIVNQPAAQTVFPGFSASFSVTVAGTPPLAYQWQFNGTNIAAATNASLTLTNVNYSNAGGYTVTVSNALGTTNSTSAALTVSPPPPCAAAPSGLISWWPAEGNGNDETGFNNGVLENGASFGSGEVGQAFSFNGVSQYVEIPDSPTLRPASVTVECWFNASAITYEGNTVMSKPVGSAGFDSFKIWLANGNLNGCAGTSTNGGPVLSYPFTPAPGAWYHAAYTLDSSAQVQTLYLNGAPVASGPAGIQIGYDAQPLLLGVEADNGSIVMPFDGRIDEASIYNRALGATEIAAIYGAAISGKCPLPPTPPIIATQPANQTVYAGSTASFNVFAGGTQPLDYSWHFGGTNIGWGTNATLALTNVGSSNAGSYYVTVSNALGATNSSAAVLTVTPAPLCAPPQASLVGWWPGQNNANDETGVNNGILMNGGWYYPGEVGQAFCFNGSNQYVQIPDSPSLRPASLTLECWFSVSNTASAGNVLISKPVGTGTNDSFELWLGHGKLYANVGTSTTKGPVLSYNFTPTAGVWYHAAFTYDSVSDLDTLFFNGSPAAVSQPNLKIGYDSSPLLIGINSANGVLTTPFAGRIDEVSIYNQALTYAEIAAIYQAGTNGKCPLPLAAPAFVVQPESQSAGVGGSVAFSATASGTAPLRYQWNDNGAAVPNATNSTLTLTNLQLTNAGNYTLTASNYAGWAVSSNAVLSVGFPPVITNQPQSQTVKAGASASFSVGASGAGVLTYQWSFNGVPLPGQNNPGILLTNVASINSGDYGVAVSNSFGAVLSSNATLNVVTPPIIITQPASRSVSAGAAVTFSVNATGTAPLTYQWQFGAFAILGATNSSLTLSNVGPDDAGSYSVVVGNAWGATNSSAAVLSIIKTLAIIAQPLNVTVTAGGTATFSVTAWASPAPVYQWRVNGANISGAVNSVLTLSNTMPSDGGSYSVIVSNNSGTITSSNAILTVNYYIETKAGKAQQLAVTNLTVASPARPGTIFVVTNTDQASVAGGTVQSANGIITYSPPVGFKGVDSFNYWLSSGALPAVEGKITALVDASLVLGGAASNTQLTLQFIGLPGTSYNIEASQDLRNWTNVGTAMAGTNGMFQYQDSMPARGWNRCYYRTALSQ